jgi:hypothetical protein
VKIDDRYSLARAHAKADQAEVLLMEARTALQTFLGRTPWARAEVRTLDGARLLVEGIAGRLLDVLKAVEATDPVVTFEPEPDTDDVEVEIFEPDETGNPVGTLTHSEACP